MINHRLLEYLDSAERVLAEYGPETVEFALLLARIDAASGLAGGFFP